MNNIISAVVWFAIISAALGLILAIASKLFAVKTDERTEQIIEQLPGANCGGCGFAGCAALADAIVTGQAPVDACSVADDKNIAEIGRIMGVPCETGKERFRAQVMCSGTNALSKKKYIYEGVSDCVAANRLAGGDKLCPNGCIGLGTCVSSCKFDAIHVVDGVAAVDYDKCRACGECVYSCPKHIIKLIPFSANYWVGCMSRDKGPITKNYCDAGCIACKLCEKACPTGAIKVTEFVAEINYDLCNECGECQNVCPRKIILSNRSQQKSGK